MDGNQKAVKTYTRNQLVASCCMVALLVAIIVCPLSYEHGRNELRREACGLGFGFYKTDKHTGMPVFSWNLVLLPVE